MLIPNGVSQWNKERYEITGYINDVNTQYTQVLMEYGTNGAFGNIYEYGMQRNSLTNGGNTSYYAYDGRGSVSEVLSSTGSAQMRYQYNAFGETTIRYNAYVDNPYRYNAEYTDYVPGVPDMQYLRARYYAPHEGRFFAQDTLFGDTMRPLTQNLYAYCSNNAVMNIDPSGNCEVPLSIRMAGSAAISSYLRGKPCRCGTVVRGTDKGQEGSAKPTTEPSSPSAPSGGNNGSGSSDGSSFSSPTQEDAMEEAEWHRNNTGSSHNAANATGGMSQEKAKELAEWMREQRDWETLLLPDTLRTIRNNDFIKDLPDETKEKVIDYVMEKYSKKRLNDTPWYFAYQDEGAYGNLTEEEMVSLGVPEGYLSPELLDLFSMPFKQNVKARMNFGEVAAMSVMQQRAQQEQAVQYLTAIAVNVGISKATNGVSTTNNTNTNTNQRQTTAENKNSLSNRVKEILNDTSGAIDLNAKVGGNKGKINLDKVNDNYLKKSGINAHQIKKDIYGRKAEIAKYDIYVDKSTGQLYTQRKPQYNNLDEPPIPTGEYIK